jgi:DNA-binding NtrC family response regulator
MAVASNFIGTVPAMAALRQEIIRVARSDAKVLITGESGVGKELVAHSIQQHSSRARRPFIVVNCAGVPDTLLESELFGHVKGSFTGAYRDKPGKLEVANGGTVLLDEVGEMTLRMQGVLLRFLETGEMQKVGAERNEGRVDVRVLTATNRNLRESMFQGTFREDLFYRLNVINIHVPPLRDRREDIPHLVRAFMDRLSHNGKYVGRTISPSAVAALVEYSWPGNVRELQNLVERLVVTASGDEIGIEDLPDEMRRPARARVKEESGRTIPDELYIRMTEDKESFWDVVYPLYMRREITRSQVRDVIRKGLQQSHGSYRQMARLFNLERVDYKRFLNFLRNHDCNLPYRDYR